jgi:hypothetical protein
LNASTFLFLNLALAFYNVGTIWAHEVDIFRSWKLLNESSFRDVQSTHWRKLPYWIFAPVAIALICGVKLLSWHPAGAPRWSIVGALSSQALSLVLTAFLWGPWQAKLAKDPLGPRSPYLARILRTHWIRTLLISVYALMLLVAAIRTVG